MWGLDKLWQNSIIKMVVKLSQKEKKEEVEEQFVIYGAGQAFYGGTRQEAEEKKRQYIEGL